MTTPHSRAGSEPAQPILTRSLLSTGAASALLINDDPHAHLLSDTERRKSLDTFMQSRPDGDLWVFAYGSLLWNPALEVAEERIARIKCWHRTFSLSMTAGRGTTRLPGLALGLERGGECLGVAYRIAEEHIATELAILWNREMLLGGYIPRWVEVMDIQGRPFGRAIAFTIDKRHRHYAAPMGLRATAQRLAKAAGGWGTAADYLRRTVEGLRRHGIKDAKLEALGVLVDLPVTAGI